MMDRKRLFANNNFVECMAPRGGFEPPACPLGGDRSILLSYRGRMNNSTTKQAILLLANYHLYLFQNYKKQSDKSNQGYWLNMI
jgi:hypothetical protein